MASNSAALMVLRACTPPSFLGCRGRLQRLCNGALHAPPPVTTFSAPYASSTSSSSHAGADATPRSKSQGSVLLVGDTKHSSETASDGRTLHATLRGGQSLEQSLQASSQRLVQGATKALQYNVPGVYMELLEQFGHGSSDANAEDGLSEQRRTREFWRAARKVARSRLEAIGPDPEPWERRIAEMHESLWVEELSVSLELSRWRLRVEDLPRSANDLYMLDVSDFSDGTGVTLDDKGLLKGVRLLLRSDDGTKTWASIQPGSGAGTLLLAAPALESMTGPFDVEFHPHRFQQVAMHRALDSNRTEALLKACEPTSPNSSGNSTHLDVDLSSLPSSLNEGQRRAVAASLRAATANPGQQPFVIWGPPGTGKSTLAAFIIWHLVRQRPTELSILAAAPSNTGADVLCQKLAKLGLGEDSMLRLNALGRSEKSVPEELQKYCAPNPDRTGRNSYSFVVPALPQLRKFRVIVTTCVAAAHIANSLRAEGANAGWFSHVVIDEAGEATEPETLVPLSLLRASAGTTVLLGDHFQLGPLVLSSLAKRLGNLEASMIERVADERFALAAKGDEEDPGLCKDMLEACEDHGLFFLTESYRSHESIMSLYSHLFYGDQLEHRVTKSQMHLLPFFQARGLPIPIIMHNVVGAERRDPGTFSIYNVEEVRLVQQYLEDLLNDKGAGLIGRDIGVITPYTRQLKALEGHLTGLGAEFASVDCGTVEKFQGQERRVVILSTVRCSRQGAVAGANVGTPTTDAVSDASEAASAASAAASRRPIGFVADPKRLNVAISRAVAGLIIVGDLQLLAAHNAQWRALLRLGQSMGVVRGEPIHAAGMDGPSSPATVAPARAVPAEESTAAWDALTS